MNETEAMIGNGLDESDKVYESLPSDTAGVKLIKMDKLKERKPVEAK